MLAQFNKNWERADKERQKLERWGRGWEEGQRE